MERSACWKRGLLFSVFAVLGAAPAPAAQSVDRTEIARVIKGHVAQIVAGLNAHDPGKTTAFDAPNIVSMECGSPPTVGAAEDRDGFKEGFARDPMWHVRLIEETVDVAGSGDMAVYRGVYNEDGNRAGVLVTHKTNFIAEFQVEGDGRWRMAWYAVIAMESSHPK